MLATFTSPPQCSWIISPEKLIKTANAFKKWSQYLTILIDSQYYNKHLYYFKSGYQIAKQSVTSKLIGSLI